MSTEEILGGAPRTDGRRAGVHHIAERIIDAGESLEQVAADFDPDIADVHRVPAHHYDHPDEMRSVSANRNTVPEDLRVARRPDDC